MMERHIERRIEGSALLVAVMMLVFMGVIGLSAMDTVSRDRQVAGYTRRTRITFFAAEAGAQYGLDALRLNSNRFAPPALPQTSLGQTADYPDSNRPYFEGDPDFAQPIRWLKSGPMPGMGLGPGTTGFQVSFWAVNARGVGPNGGDARVEVGKRIPTHSGFGN